jgi:hypothetical protein
MTVTIYSEFVKASMEQDANGHAPAGYTAYTLNRTSKPVAVITGDVKPADMGWGITGLVVAQYPHKGEPGPHALRDVLRYAQRGMYGLTVI